MKLSEQAIKDFQLLYEKNFGVKLTYEDASLEAVQLIKLVALMQPEE
jgi:hypothetical protein